MTSSPYWLLSGFTASSGQSRVVEFAGITVGTLDRVRRTLSDGPFPEGHGSQISQKGIFGMWPLDIYNTPQSGRGRVSA